jgi:hypothetical protein
VRTPRDFDVEAIPVRWMYAVFGDEKAPLYVARPDLIPGEAKAALMQLLEATCTRLGSLH